MNSKEKQKEFITIYLKPLLKANGFKTNGLNWWKNKGEFHLMINLQNSQWNNLDSISFCFNIGIAINSEIDLRKSNKILYSDYTIHMREGSYLSDERRNHKYRFASSLGYTINNDTNINDFISEIKIDFEAYILPSIEKMNTLNDCIYFYDTIHEWGDRLKRIVEEI